jgi:hypothetical protein
MFESVQSFVPIGKQDYQCVGTQVIDCNVRGIAHWGVSQMEAPKLLEAAPYGPDTIRILKQVFEEIWASIAFTIPPDLIENTRLSLAHAIVAHAGLGDNDCETLKAAALDAIQKHPPQLSVLG